MRGHRSDANHLLRRGCVRESDAQFEWFVQTDSVLREDEAVWRTNELRFLCKKENANPTSLCSERMHCMYALQIATGRINKKRSSNCEIPLFTRLSMECDP